MKLYTEEQVRQMLKSTHIHTDNDVDMIIPKFNPIELPSDEEIEEQAHIQYPVNLQPNGRTLAGGKHNVDINYSGRNAYVKCAKWLRDKITSGNNERK